MTVDKIADVISKALIKKGWLQAGANNNVMVKNNVLFVYHKGDYDNQPKRSFNYGGEQMTTNCRPVLLNPSNCSWHLERFGWLLDKGNIQATIEDLYDAEANTMPGAKAILDELVERVDACACKSDIAIKSMKQRLTPIQTKKVQYSAEDTDKPLDKRTYFKAVGNPLPEPLRFGKVYYIQDYDSSNFYCDAMNNNLSGVKKNGHFTLPVELFLFLAKEKVIVPCEIRDSVEIVEDTVWLGLEGTSNIDFPECLTEFNIPKSKQSIVAQAFNDSLNITPFLNPQYDKESLKVLYDFKDTVALGEFSNLDCDSATLQELLSLRSQGYCIDSLKHNNYSAEYIKAIFDESFGELRAFEAELAKEGFNTEQIRELMHLHFDGVNLEKIKNPDYSAHVMNMLAYTEAHPEFKQIANLFSEKAFSGEKLYVPADFMSADEKGSIRNIFKVGDNSLTMDGTPWNTFIEGLLDNLRYVYYLQGRGFLFRTGNLGLGIEDNSFYMTELTDIPKWRATYINEKFYVNRVNEPYLYY